MQCSVHADMKLTKQGKFQQKTNKNNPVMVKSVSDSNSKSSVTLQYDKISI